MKNKANNKMRSDESRKWANFTRVKKALSRKMAFEQRHKYIKDPKIEHSEKENNL